MDIKPVRGWNLHMAWSCGIKDSTAVIGLKAWAHNLPFFKVQGEWEQFAMQMLGLTGAAGNASAWLSELRWKAEIKVVCLCLPKRANRSSWPPNGCWPVSTPTYQKKTRNTCRGSGTSLVIVVVQGSDCLHCTSALCLFYTNVLSCS